MKRILSLLIASVMVIGILTSCQAPGEGTDRVAIAGDYVEAFIDQDYRELGSFSLTFRMRWSLNNRVYRTIKDQLFQEFGEFIEVSEVEETVSGEYYIVRHICRFTGGYGNINVVFDGKNRIAGLNYTFNKTYKEDDESINVLFGREYTLPGSMIVPSVDNPVPAVIIVHGSGPSDRNGEFGGNAVYFDIAQKLAEKGIASLRYDKRTYVYQDPNDYDMGTFTVYDETINDVVSAFKFLSLQPGIDPKEIYIIGHSLGGYLIPRIAKEIPDAKGFIMLAPNATPIEDLMIVQTEYIYGIDGRISKTEQNTIDSIAETAEIIRHLAPGDAYESSELLNAPVSYWLDLRDYNPLFEIGGIERPVLIVHGERDYQVNRSEYELWHSSVMELDNVESVLLPGLNHMFAYGTEASTPQEYYKLSEVDSSVIDLISEFIGENQYGD